MVASQKVLQSFLSDALRMCAEASECLKQLADQAVENRVSPAQVRSFFQLIHSLKGTACMVGGGEPIVQSLHMIEGRLACQSVVESARNPDWIELGSQSIDQVSRALHVLQRKEKFPVPLPEPLVKGILVQMDLESGQGLLWFPLTCVSRVMLPEELGTAPALCVQGAWVPVLGAPQTESRKQGVRFGVVVHAGAGNAVLSAIELCGVMAWSKALAKGARAGLEIFDSVPAQSSVA